MITFTRDVALHAGGEAIRAFHIPDAHTNGDVVVHFPASNAIHVGDLMFEGMYPFIDLDSGGSIDGTIAALERIGDLIDEQTSIIAGHGPVSNKAALMRYLEMLKSIRDAVEMHVAAGRSLEEVVAARPTARFDGGLVNGAQFSEAVYRSLAEGT